MTPPSISLHHWTSPSCNVSMELFQIRAGRVCILTCNTITVSQTPQLNAVNPSQTAVCRQEMPWVVQLISGSTFPFIQRHTHTHIQVCSKPPGPDAGQCPRPGDHSVTCFSCASVLLHQGQRWKNTILLTSSVGYNYKEFKYCQTTGCHSLRLEQGGWAVMLGRAAQTIDCFKSKFPNITTLYSKTLLWSTGILQWLQDLQPIGTSVCIYVCVYIHLYTLMCVSHWGSCIKTVFYSFKRNQQFYQEPDQAPFILHAL